mmetsp:Transcript_10421/g.15853  ORF Transcript_10421/g.15853 Transcript_10421/m.15853 type:complete len:91 (+) Transcript_10421:609-881(+)
MSGELQGVVVSRGEDRRGGGIARTGRGTDASTFARREGRTMQQSALCDMFSTVAIIESSLSIRRGSLGRFAADGLIASETRGFTTSASEP